MFVFSIHYQLSKNWRAVTNYSKIIVQITKTLVFTEENVSVPRKTNK